MEIEISITESEKRAIGLLIGFTKHVYFRNVPENIDIWKSDQFIPNSSDNKPGHIETQWWITVKGKKLIINLVSHFKNTANGYIERDAIESNIIQFFKDNLFHKEIFSSDSIMFSDNKTLFDSRIYENQFYFGYILYNKLLTELNNYIEKILFIYPLYRFKSPSFTIDKGLNFISNRNIEEFTKLYDQFPQLKHFNPIKGTLYNDKTFFNSKYSIDGWMLFHVLGEITSCVNVTKLKMKMFFSVLFSTLIGDNIGFSYSNTQTQETYGIRFSKKKISCLHIGNIVHSYLEEISLSVERIKIIQDIYSKVKSLDTEKQKRYEIATNFFINSMTSNDLDKYINLFIVLDALWGIDGNSRNSIIDGICKVTGSDVKSKEKAKYLYDLRCEIMHGSCILIDDWDDYDIFYNKFNSDPINELLMISINAFKNVIL